MGYSRVAYQKGSSFLVPYAKQLIKALRAEHELNSLLIPKHHGISCFVTTITQVVHGFIETTEAVINRVRKNYQKKDANDIYMLIDIWEGLDGATENHQALLAHCGKIGHEINHSLSNCMSTVLVYLSDIYDEFVTEDGRLRYGTLSPDGTVHEMTSMTMNNLKRLYDSEEAIELMISKSPSKKNGSFPFESLGDYSSKLVKALLDDIDQKSKGYKKNILIYLFSLNNIHYVFKGIKGTKAAESLGERYLADMEKNIKKQLDGYRGSWMALCEFLMDNTKISETGKIITTLTKPQRDAIKEKFKNFNKEFDDL